MTMRARAIVRTAVLAGAFALLGFVASFGEQAQPGGGGPRGNFSPEQMRQRQLERIKETMKPTDDEWKALQPKLDKVLTLSADAGLTAGRGLFGRRGGQPAAGTEATAAAAQSDAEKAAAELQKTLDNAEATADDIKAKMKALQDARGKARQQLTEAKAALREGLTPRQEAQLVHMAILD
jgi:hypothetical protein